MTVTQTPLLGKIRLNSEIALKTGLHIGGGGETLDIGGIDKPVIRDPLTSQPYLPGSSIKGKLRAILERLLNQPLNRITRSGGIKLYRHECDYTDRWFVSETTTHEGAEDCPVCRVFGSTGNDCTIPNQNNEPIKHKGANKPARILVRDCHLVDRSAEELKRIGTGLYMTEWKFENGLDRVTAAANPRQIERVPAGSLFNFELVYTVENAAQVQEDIKNIALAIAILEDDALGGHGSRGYGKIKFQDFRLSYRDYRRLTETSETSIELESEALSMKTTEELLRNFGQVQNLLPGS
jgi:CRISPR-associated protein Csm3